MIMTARSLQLDVAPIQHYQPVSEHTRVPMQHYQPVPEYTRVPECSARMQRKNTGTQCN